MAIRQLVYVSQTTVDFDRAQLDALLLGARRYNQQRGICGVLLHSPGLFAQCLEGEAPAIEALYTKIGADGRHTNIVCLQDITLPARCFSEWSMGCVSVAAPEIDDLKQADWQRAIDSHDGRPWISPGFALMHALWDMHRARQF